MEPMAKHEVTSTKSKLDQAVRCGYCGSAVNAEFQCGCCFQVAYCGTEFSVVGPFAQGHLALRLKQNGNEKRMSASEELLQGWPPEGFPTDLHHRV